MRRSVAIIGVLMALGLSTAAVRGTQPPPAAQPPAAADEPAGVAAPAHLAVLEGAAVITREGRADEAAEGEPLVIGDRLATDGGRAAVFLPSGSVLYLDHRSRVDLQGETLFRLGDGVLVFVMSDSDAAAGARYVFDAQAGSIWVTSAGEYRIHADALNNTPPSVAVAVARGEATIVTNRATRTIRAGEQAITLGETPTVTAYNVARWDDFDRWVQSQRDAYTAFNTPTSPLPAEVASYAGVLEQYGSWDTTDEYGAVWYPQIPTGWRPYADGHWRHYDRFGWTWIAQDRWGWPTHHFGRWEFGQRGWFWAPGAQWGPGWVYWTNTSGLTAWCPLGIDGRPAIGFGGGPTDLYRARGFVDPWSAWTVVSTSSLGQGRSLQPYRLDGHGLDQGAVGVMASQVAGGRPGPALGVRRGGGRPGGPGRGPGPGPGPIGVGRRGFVGGVFVHGAVGNTGRLGSAAERGPGYGGYGDYYGGGPTGAPPDVDAAPYVRADRFMQRPPQRRDGEARSEPAPPPASLTKDLELAEPFKNPGNSGYASPRYTYPPASAIPRAAPLGNEVDPRSLPQRDPQMVPGQTPRPPAAARPDAARRPVAGAVQAGATTATTAAQPAAGASAAPRAEPAARSVPARRAQ